MTLHRLLHTTADRNPVLFHASFSRRDLGIMTRSGSLTNEVTSMVVAAGYGVSTLTGVGGDPQSPFPRWQ